ncbi:MAG: GldM family protein [Flavobacteriales bacterium]|nr:GldM family protein [Flavobacteriales bacterium]
MGGGKETPRQKMVGLMYLVLMALLAMNVSKEIINAFVTLNNKLESSIEQVESFNTGLSDEFATKLATLKATGAPPDELARVEFHKNTNDSIVALTRHMCNDLVKRNLFLLIAAADPSITFEEFDDIEEAIVSDDAEAKVKLKAIVDRVNDLGLIAVDEHHELHNAATDHDEYHNPLFHIDDEGYIHIRDLSTYTKKDDYDTPTRILAGESFELIAPEGLHLMENLHHYRNDLISLIADHPSDTLEGGLVYQYKFDTSLIKDPDFLLTEGERKAFEKIVDSIIAFEIEENKLDPADAEAVRNIYVRMTIPKKVMNHGEEYPWIFGQFDHAPIVAASAVMTSVRSDVLQVQTLASQLVSSRVKVQSFNFNKIDPLAFSSTSYINQGDSLGLRVMIAAYDSSEAMELKYWEDDTSQLSKSDADRDLANMRTFKGRAGESVSISGSVGDHVLAGFIAVKEKGVKKWKPWKFNYAVGAPNAAISAADLQVLYINWNNKIRVSASGYKPEAIRLIGRGCNVKGPDSKGFYTATVTNVRAKEAKLIVTAIDDKGKSVELANEKFRIFPLPKPTAYFAGKAGGNLKKANAMSYSTIVAKLGESPLDVPYTVVGFSMYTTKNGSPITYKSKSNRLTGPMKAAIKKIPKGGNLTFTGVDVKGPGGKVKRLESGIVIKLI